MKYIQEWGATGWHLYQNAQGFIEGYKGVGGKVAIDKNRTTNKDIDRIVTTTTDPEEFGKFLNKKTGGGQKYNSNNESQIRAF